MIKEFNNLPCRDSAIIYQSCLEQIKMLFEVNPQLAGELAISVIEMALCGEVSSDDYTIKIIVQGLKPLFSKNKDRYEKRIENKKLNRIAELKLEEIASLTQQNYTQQEIGKKLGISQQIVSNRLKIIRLDYPELLKCANTKNTKNTNESSFCTNLYSREKFVKSEDKSDNLQKIQELQAIQQIQTHDNDNEDDNEDENEDDTVSDDVSDTVSVSDTVDFKEEYREEQAERAYYISKPNLQGTITLSELEGQKFDYLGKYKLFVKIQGQNGIYELI